VYMGAQHAREWITPEMNTRLLDLILDGYGSNPTITRLVQQTEMWFIPVANPDGYDFSFEEGQRLWRKNLRDNDGNGVITTGDGVDLNRNFPTRWGYDNEGSSPNPTSETYRGPHPASEPETQALDSLFARITPQFLVNYHSAAELLLYGIGWQVATPTPDDIIYETMAGDDANPAIPGYDPDLSAELYTTNGDTDTHMQEAHGTLGFTPEMSTCQAASEVDPNDEWVPEDCGSGFEFPDDEGLVQQEFEKNVPFALSVAASAIDPDDPVSVVGRTAEDFRVDTFDVSYGDPQTVAVWAKRAIQNMSMLYRINGGPIQRSAVSEWTGGERYGGENDDYYAEFRGQVQGAGPGDGVEVWFVGRKSAPTQLVASQHFTYTVASDTGKRALVIANEDYTGVNPTYPPSVNGPKYLDEHVAALAAAGVQADTWDVDAQGVPHDLGVLAHYDLVLWYLGDNRLTQDPEDELIDFFGVAELPDIAVAERQQYLTMAVRDYLNEGGKLIHSGETTAYYGLLANDVGGIFYGLDGAPEEECVLTEFYDDCLFLADDFSQYYLGAYDRTALDSASGVIGTRGPIAGASIEFGGPATAANPIDEPGAFTVTSDVLPVQQFPQFASVGVAEYLDPVGPFIAIEGDFAVGVEHADDTYARLQRTYDLTSVTAAEAPEFQAQFSYSTEPDYDHVIVEARTVGQENWTTLPDLGGLTTDVVPAECEAGFLLETHPWLAHYLTLGNPCLPQGTTGNWNSFTGESGGWQPVAFDLSAYAGQQVEITISYVTDFLFGGAGLIVDDTKLVTTAGVFEAEGFEEGLGAWQVLGAPAGSPENTVNFERTPGLGGITAAVATRDTVLFGFGLEQLALPAARAALVRAVEDLMAAS
ncbi:MAG: zinc carboxypeptidase, partial [Actinomycetota bacterium]|nr:zinc carboxypeptidase [Actinomycetota bacterium]